MSLFASLSESVDLQHKITTIALAIIVIRIATNRKDPITLINAAQTVKSSPPESLAAPLVAN